MKIKCKSCGSIFDVEAENLEQIGPCTNCNNHEWIVLNNSHVYCRTCGGLIAKTAQICPHCGAEFKGVTIEHIRLSLNEVFALVFQVVLSLFIIASLPFIFILILIFVARMSK